jgi:hypothetical protein
MIEDDRLALPIQNQDDGRLILHGLIERIVVNPLADFGILQADYKPHKILGVKFRELSAFQITPFGKGLLETVKGISRYNHS